MPLRCDSRKGNRDENRGKSRDRGLLRVDVEECKGLRALREDAEFSLSERLNHYGYRTAI